MSMATFGLGAIGMARSPNTYASLSIADSQSVSGTLEDGYEKIAIFASSEEFDHVAFQREDGCWSSKLGELGDVMHKTRSSLGGAGCFEYADVAMFMRRVREPHPLAHTGLLLPGLG